MSETLTASFCERCGSRHEFRAPTGVGPVRKTRGFIGGLRNYLVGEDGFSDAMRDSMQMQESAVTAAQLDAFHAAVHLCLDCRQYTCNACWNADAGRCLSCVPVAGEPEADAVAATWAQPDDVADVTVFEAAATPLSAESWPTADHEVFPAAGFAPLDVGQLDEALTADASASNGHAPLADDETDGMLADSHERLDGVAAARAMPSPDAGAPSRDADLEFEDAERHDVSAPAGSQATDESPAWTIEPDEPSDDLPTVPGDAAAEVAEEAAATPATPGRDAATIAAELEAELAAAYAGAMERLTPFRAEGPIVPSSAVDPDPQPDVTSQAAPEREPEPEPIGAFADEGAETEAAWAEPAVDEGASGVEGDAFEAERPALRLVAWDDDDARDLAATASDAATTAPEDESFAAEVEATHVTPPAAYNRETADDAWDAPATWLDAGTTGTSEGDVAATDVDLSPGEASVAHDGTPGDMEFRPAAAADYADAYRDAPEPMATDRDRAAAPGEDEPREAWASPPADTMPGRSVPMRDRRAPRRSEPPRVERVAANLDTPEASARRAQLEELGLGPSAPPEAAIVAFPPTTPDGGGSVWEASAREVGAAGVTVRNCAGCGLALSASAHFCRRCGTRQAKSA